MAGPPPRTVPHRHRPPHHPAGRELVSAGVTWRELAALLKALRFEKELVAEIGADPEELSPRDRQRFWYSAIALARPDCPEALAEAERLAAAVKPLGLRRRPAAAPARARPPAGRPKPKPKKKKK